MAFNISMAIFAMVCVALGLLSQRKGFEDSADYYVSHRKVGPFLQSMTMFATISSSAAMMGIIGFI